MVRFFPEEYERYKTIAKKEKCSIAEVIRVFTDDACQMYYNQQPTTNPYAPVNNVCDDDPITPKQEKDFYKQVFTCKDIDKTTKTEVKPDINNGTDIKPNYFADSLIP
jgi:hypothetical protein